MSRYVVSIQMDTRVQVSIPIECEDANIHKAIEELTKSLEADGAKQIEVISCVPYIDVEPLLDGDGKRVLN